MFIYYKSPQDDFTGLFTLDELIEENKRIIDDERKRWNQPINFDKLIKNVVMSCLLLNKHDRFKNVSNDFDIRDLLFFPILSGDGFIEFGFILKLENGGCTFIFSPFPMPHLE